jgi:trimeric autotransporter adhesin
MQCRALLLALISIMALPWAASQTIASAPTASPSIVAASAPTAVPPLVPFAGIALDASGKPLSSPSSITFLIYKEEIGGEPLFAETQSVLLDASGRYKVQLGASNPNGLPADLFSTGEARWLEVQVAGETPQPRVLLVSVPYALKAADAATLGGLPPSAFALARPASETASGVSAAIVPNVTSNVTTTGGTVGFVPEFSGTSSVVDSPIFVNTSGAVGIGTTTPTATLTVQGAMTVAGTSTLNGQVLLLPQGTATASEAFNSQFMKLSSSAFNSSTHSAVSPRFQLQVEPTGNDTASPNGTLNLLASATTNAPVETGFFINTNGTIHFAPGQTFPGADITGTVNASGYDLGGSLFATGSTANSNAYLGFAGNTSSTGIGNTASGDQAMRANTSGDYNTADGFQAMNANTTGYSNTAIGQEALFFNTSGYANTAIGNLALSGNTIGNSNTAIGAAAGPDSDSFDLSNATAVGANATVSQSNTLVLGQTKMGSPGASYVNVGIGTATPRSTLEAVVEEFGAVAPVLTLTNSGGSAEVAIDFNTYLPSTTGNYNPSARIFAADNGDYADYLYFASNASGAPNNGELNTMQIAPNGDVYAYGTLSSGSADLKIDHPIDPANRFLVHSSVESSEMVNIYSGNVVTDELGLAAVKLPDWFEAENTDFRYQLTVVGRQAQAWIAEEVGNGQFKVATNATHVKVSWQITAVRQDAYAKAHPLVVEQEKLAGERGFYAHPELYGQPIDKQIGGHAHDQPASAVDKHFPVPAAPVPALPRHARTPAPTISQLNPK